MKFFFPGENNELDAVSAFSEIVPDTVVFDDFERLDISLLHDLLVSVIMKFAFFGFGLLAIG